MRCCRCPERSAWRPGGGGRRGVVYVAGDVGLRACNGSAVAGVAAAGSPGRRRAVGEDAAAGADDVRLRLQLEELVHTMCKALNDPKRLMLLYALRDGAHTVGELCELVGAPQSNTSQHLAVLRQRGLVATERQGNKVLYSLRYQRILDAVDILRQIMADEGNRQLQLRSLPAG